MAGPVLFYYRLSLKGGPFMAHHTLTDAKDAYMALYRQYTHEQNYAQNQIFRPLERLATLEQRVTDEGFDSLHPWPKKDLTRLREMKEELQTNALVVRSSIRAAKEGCDDALVPAWEHIANSVLPSWAKMAEIKPKALRLCGGELCFNLAIFATNETRARVAVTLVKSHQTEIKQARNSFGYVHTSSATLYTLRNFMAYAIKNHWVAHEQIARLGWSEAYGRMLEEKKVLRCRNILQEAGIPVGTEMRHEIRVMHPKELSAISVWMNNCVGRRYAYADRVQSARGAIIAAYPTSGPYRGLPMSIAEIRPTWTGLTDVEWASRYVRGENQGNPGQAALRTFLAKKTTAKKIGMVADSMATSQYRFSALA